MGGYLVEDFYGTNPPAFSDFQPLRVQSFDDEKAHCCWFVFGVSWEEEAKRFRYWAVGG